MTKGFEHLRILVSMVGPGTNPPCIPREHCISQMKVLVTQLCPALCDPMARGAFWALVHGLDPMD